MPLHRLNTKSIFYAWNRIKSDAQLILIHGAGGRHIDWPKELRHNRQISTYAVDLPGHFKAPPPLCYSVEEMGETLIEFIEEKRLKRVILLGHSMGGGVGQYIALQNRPWLEGLILIGSAPKMPVTPVILDQIHTDLDAVADFIVKYAFNRQARGLVKGAVRKIIMENDPDVLHADFSASNRFDFRERLGEIGVKTVLIGGKRDKFTPLEQSQLMATEIPNATLETVEAGGHYMFIEQPLPITRLILRILKTW